MPGGCPGTFLSAYAMRSVMLALIRLYQRYISPYKGFCCAYRCHTGRQSCSALGFRAIRRYGVLSGVAVLRRRLDLCGVAHRRYSPPFNRAFQTQRGMCDVGCDVPCDCSDVDACSLLDFVNCCDCSGCDWPGRKQKEKEQAQYVYLPPRYTPTTGASGDENC